MAGALTVQAIQRDYYKRTAAAYDDMHVAKEQYVALRYITAFLKMVSANTVIDFGCGTGRGVRYLAGKGFAVRGVEPSAHMLEQATTRHACPPHHFVRGKGQSAPFADQSFDAACELAMLHHVPDPDSVIREMMRVARKAIFLADANRFGQGPVWLRRTKLTLYKAGLWPTVDFLKTGGKGYMVSEGDGLFYSYSVFDSLHLLRGWADEVFVVPTANGSHNSWHHPLLTSTHVLLCAVRGIA